MLFVIEDQKFYQWKTLHNSVCPHANLNERFTFLFAPTSLGVFKKVICTCGEEFIIQNPNEKED